MDHTIIVSPYLMRNGSKSADRFCAWLENEPTRVLCTSREPLLAAARALLKSGIAAPEDVLVMRHANSDTVALKISVGCAAGLTIQEASDRAARPVRYRSRERVEVPARMSPGRSAKARAANLRNPAIREVASTTKETAEIQTDNANVGLRRRAA